MRQDDGKLIFSITDTIDNIPKSDWDRLFDPDCIEGWGFHKTIEQSGIKEFSFHYALIKRNGLLCAIIPFFINDFSFATIIQGPLQKLIFFVQKFWRRFLWTKIIFVGNPLTEKLRIGIPSDELINEVMREAINGLCSFSAKTGASAMLFYNLTEGQKDIASALEQNGLLCMENFPNTVLEIKAKNLEDFIQSLGSSTRKDLRRKLRKTASLATLKTEVLTDIFTIQNELYKLYTCNFEQSDVRFETLTPEFFRNIQKNMPESARFFITRSGKEIVAFNLCLVKDNILIDKVIGMDKTISHMYSLYYTTFCENIDWCIKNGIRYYCLGITDYHPKLRLGAKLIPLYIYVKLFNPFLKLFSRPLVRFIQPKNFDPILKNLEKNNLVLREELL
ncbi:MAG: GNAT family N-acetyltransferase [Candidatus Omnitrophica bacterium]|nr:GNAT family N-acetyltransferase [Candidatus Omnitrophota bacterium]